MIAIDVYKRQEQHTHYLAEVLKKAGMHVYQPSGGHAVYVDAAQTLPHISPLAFPGVALSLIHI